MNQERTIEIWEPAAPVDADTKAALPTFGKARIRATQIETSVLAGNLKEVLASFQEILDAQPKTATGYHIEEIELALGVNGKGGFALIGSAEVGVQASVKVKLKKTAAE